NKPVANKELWQKLANLIKVHKVKFVKVKGHSDNEYNNLCDQLAREALKNKKGI
ncbi:MAG: ribonuclease HI, partial [Clostridia bacterium]|nr:ribonuclease HI [Clostridia bacterium]